MRQLARLSKEYVPFHMVSPSSVFEPTDIFSMKLYENRPFPGYALEDAMDIRIKSWTPGGGEG